MKGGGGLFPPARRPPRSGALESKLFETDRTAPRHGRVIRAKRAEAMADEHAQIVRRADRARPFGKVPAALAHGASLAQACTRRRRRARASLARNGGKGTLVLF